MTANLPSSTNITLGIIGCYCYFPTTTLLTPTSSLVTSFPLSSNLSLATLTTSLTLANTYFNDLAFLAAVNVANQDPNFLPGIHVNVKRFSDCGEYYEDAVDIYSGNSGGYVVSQMASDIVEVADLVAVVGNEYSTTARASAEALSYYQIPYCSSGSASPRLSDKNKYPYFYRPLPSKGLGDHISKLLTSWSVRRAAIIYEKDDELGVNFANDIAQSFGKNNIQLIAKVGIISANSDALYVKTQLDQTSARYIILSGQNAFISTMYFALSSQNMTGPDYVYLSYNSPMLSSTNPNETTQIQGFIQFQQLPPILTTPLFQTFYSQVLHLAQIDESQMSPFTLTDNNNIGASPAFDCVMVMLKGIANLLASRNATPEDLAARKLQAYMNYTLFRNVGFSGLDVDPVTFSESGDLMVPYQISYFTGVGWTQTVFGFTNADATNLTIVGQVNFNGGGNLPPLDGPSVMHNPTYTLAEYSSTIVIVLALLGILLSVLSISMLVWLRKNPIIRSIAVDYTCLFLAGTIIGFIAILNDLVPVSTFQCQSRQWLTLTAYILTISPLIAKNFYLWILINSKQKLAVEKLNWILYLATACSILIEAVILWLMSSYTTILPHLYAADSEFNVYICKVVSSAPFTSILLYAYNAILLVTLLFLSFLTQNLHTRYNESRILMLVFLTILATFGVIQTLPMNSDHMNDLRRVTCMWACGVTLVILVIGSRVCEMWIEMVGDDQLRLMMWGSAVRSSAGKGLVPGKTSGRLVVSLILSPPRRKRESFVDRVDGRPSAIGAKETTVFRTDGYARRPLEGIHIFRIRKGRRFWSKWMTSPIAINAIRETYWISLFLDFGGPAECFPITRQTTAFSNPQKRIATIVLTSSTKIRDEMNNPSFHGYEIEIATKNALQAEALVAEYQGQLRDMVRERTLNK